ncbi:MAG TPA: DUF3224 domain-containing protein [Candidatus Bathyarchaeia archaeon]|nr:DUF3224 domain-containing protein [Candidatus Bathyarchaeia archaeon]
MKTLRILLALLSPLLLLLLPVAYAAPTSASGSFTVSNSPPTARAAGGNMILTYDSAFTSTGTFVGTCSGQAITLTHSDGTANTKATCTFIGTVGDKSGTAMFLIRAQGKGSSFQGHFTLLAGGTGDLASLRAEGSFSGTATGPLTSAGTYTGKTNFT